MASEYEGFDYEEASRQSNAAIAALAKRRKSPILEEGIAADFMSDPENMAYPRIVTAQADMFQELGTTSPETTLTYTVDEAKRAASGLNDTGLREDAPSGATREPTTGKGAFHLVTPAIGEVFDGGMAIEDYDARSEERIEDILAMAIKDAYRWLATNNINYLDWAIDNIILACSCESQSHGFSNALMRLARHYENGAAKYNFNKDFESIPEVLEWLKSSAKIVEKLSLNMLEIDVEAVMKNGLEQTIQNMLKDKGIIPKNGMNFTLMLDMTIQNYGKKIQNLEQETNSQSKETSLNKEDLQKKVMNLFGSLKIINALFVDENLMKWQLPILTMTTQQDGQEDYYAVGAITDWDSLKMILSYCQKQLNIWNSPPLQLSLKSGKINCFKTGDRNWEKGLSSARCFDSGIRHMVRYINNDRSEDHLAAALWNLAGIKHYLMFGYYDTIEGVNDLTMPWRGTLKERE